MPLNLNERAWTLADQIANTAETLRVQESTSSEGTRILDCGVKAEGGLQAGLWLARVCLADLGEVSLLPGEGGEISCPQVQVQTDHPVLACLASQYAGWQVKTEKFLGMASGPMRAVYGKEAIFGHIDHRERPERAVGVMETHKLPPAEAIAYLSSRLGLPANRITLLLATSSSVAGLLQVVARSIETALHKLHELKFDVKQIVSGHGVAPLPPPTPDVLQAIGRSNDAILYGGRVTLWVRCNDDELAAVGPKVPSSASPDHGAPFAQVLKRADGDFYKIDPMLFSPAEIVFQNLTTGRLHRFGHLTPDVLRKSFFDS